MDVNKGKGKLYDWEQYYRVFGSYDPCLPGTTGEKGRQGGGGKGERGVKR